MIKEEEEEDMDRFDALFAIKMKKAGVTRKARIGIAVSGGPDSTALCILASRWIVNETGDLMAFIVDHGLRPESCSEALTAQDRVSKLGIKSEVLKCIWRDRVPSKGHLQEAARNARYEQLQMACKRNNVDVLLTAHHADDQAELFVIRLSRHSGLAGLAGIPLASDMLRCMPEFFNGKDVVVRTRVVRPLLHFTKSDLQQVCTKHMQPWIEDPSNKNLVFLRNMIREILNEPEFSFLKNELAHVIKLCREMRSLSDRDRDTFLKDTVSIDKDLGYAVMNLEKLNLSEVTTQVFARAVVALMQFVAQREKPPRGKVVQRLTEQIEHGDFKGALTIGGCNICMAPGSKGSRLLISHSHDSKAPLSAEPINSIWPYHQVNSGHGRFTEMNQKCVKGDVKFEMETINGSNEKEADLVDKLRNAKNTEDFLFKAKQEGILSDKCIMALSKIVDDLSMKPLEQEPERVGFGGNRRRKDVDRSSQLKIPCGHACYFTNRFLIAWGKKENHNKVNSDEIKCCSFQKVNTLWVRFMEEKDWAFLYRHAEGFNVSQGAHRNQSHVSSAFVLPCCSISSLASKAQALHRLKSIPVIIRRTLPVLVSAEGALISIPSLQLSLCPNIWTSSMFSPKVPLGGGTTLWK